MSLPNSSYRTGPYAPSGIPVANGMSATTSSCSTSATAASTGVKLVTYEECETGYKTERRRRVLREAQEQGHADRRLAGQPLQHRHHLPADPQGAGRQGGPIHVHGLWPHRGRRRPGLPVGVQLPDHLLESGLGLRASTSASRKAALDKLKGKKIAHVIHPQQPLRQGSQPDPQQILAEKHGYELLLLPVDHPGQEQKATWLQIRRTRSPTGSSCPAGA